MERSQVKRGHMQALKPWSFCCCVMGVASIFSSMELGNQVFPTLSGGRVDSHRSSKESEGVVSQIRNGVPTEYEVGVVDLSCVGFDGNCHKLWYIDMHARPC